MFFRLRIILAVAALLLCVQGCTLIYEMEPSVFQVTGDIECGAMDTRITLTVSCDAYWSVGDPEDDWAVLYSPRDNYIHGNGLIVILFGHNLADESRSTVIEVKSGSKIQKLTIVQGGISSFFEPSELVLSTKTPATLNFNSPDDWTAKLTNHADCFQLSSNSGSAGFASITVTAVEENYDVVSRSSSLEITIGEEILTVPVIQLQDDILMIKSQEPKLDYNGGEFTVKTAFNVDYEILVQNSWIHYLPNTKALNEAEERFYVDANPFNSTRTGTIVFRINSIPDIEITVIQTGVDMSLLQTVPGVYCIGGQSYRLGEAGWNLSSRVLSSNGRYEYRMLNSADLSVIRVTGIDPGVAPGAACNVHVVMYKGKDVTMVRDIPAKVSAVDDECIRLSTQSDTYFLIQRPL